MPFFPYSRQDKVGRCRNSLASKMLLKILEISGANRIVTLSIHSDEICNFTKLPIINLNPYFFLIDQLEDLTSTNRSSWVIIAPDFGGSMRCKNLIKSHDSSFALIHKGKFFQSKNCFNYM